MSRPPLPPVSYQHHVGGASEVLPLPFSSQRQQYEQQQQQLKLQHLAADPTSQIVDVPTLPHQVRDALRQLGLPVRLFGENLANIRDRLRVELIARKQLLGDGAAAITSSLPVSTTIKQEHAEEEAVTKYTRASQALVDARLEITKFSLQRAKERLQRERSLKRLAQAERKRKLHVDNDDNTSKLPASTELSRLDDQCLKMYKSLRGWTLQGSQYADVRALSCISCQTNGGMPLAATSSWTGTVKLWDASSAALSQVGEHAMCHEDRIMNLDMVVSNSGDSLLLATASLDKTAKIWKINKSDIVMDDANEGSNADATATAFTISEQATLKGHAARLCQVAFHPLQPYVATTSFDYSWRLWDATTGQDLLLQDGHARACYGLGFHNDGSLVATTDFCGLTHVWDLRTGKSIAHFTGHAKRVLQAQFHPNGFLLATAGDDGTVKVWDLRQRKLAVNVPAHSGLITRLAFDTASSGEWLASSSFDGTVRLWSTRSWKLLRELKGHEGKVTGVDVCGNGVVTTGFDKTLKLWS